MVIPLCERNEIRFIRIQVLFLRENKSSLSLSLSRRLRRHQETLRGEWMGHRLSVGCVVRFDVYDAIQDD